MFRRSRTTVLKDNAITGKELALALSRDKKFRKQLISAIGHGTKAKRRASRRIGFLAAASRLANDKQLRRELETMTKNLDQAWSRVQRKQKRSHKLRNTILVLGGGAAAAGAALKLRGNHGSHGSAISTIDESIEVGVPISTAYNQWTQFEEFPLFMEGIDDVRQRDDTRLHWVATIGGHTAEWDAKILEQHPDKQISWISEDGKKTRGTVSFESLGESTTLIRLSMSYQAEGPLEQLGSAAGLDAQRVRGDLKRFKDLIESRGTESGEWRGEIEAGKSN
jgi:uncharacterized membrane protein